MSYQDNESKIRTILFEFEHGDPYNPTYVRVTNSFSPINYGGQTYQSEPLVGYEEEFLTGGVEDKPFFVVLPLKCDQAPTQVMVDGLASPAPFSPVRVRVLELTKLPSSSGVEVSYLAEGEVSASQSNPEDMEGFLKLETLASKSNLSAISLGIPANPTCGLTYGGAGCGINTGVYYDGSSYFPNNYSGGFPLVRRAYIELRQAYPSADRTQVVDIRMSATRHPGASQLTLTTMPRGWWINAHLEKDGIVVPIRDWWWNSLISSGTNFFVLGKIPPKSWFYDNVQDNYLVLVPGCSKTKIACGLRNNSSNWDALGYAIPAYNPLYDEPS